MLWNYRIPFIISIFILFFMSKVPFSTAQGVDDPETADMQTELYKLKAEMQDMKRAYDLKLSEMEEKLAALEEEKRRHSWGKLEVMPYVRSVALKEGMAPEEKAKIEEELKAIMGEPVEQEPQKKAAYPGTQEKGFIGGVFSRIGASRGILQTYNPDISIIGDFLGTFIKPGTGLLFKDGGFEKNEFADRFSFREVEIGLQSAIDPYAKADFFLTMEDADGFELEEGYMTWLTMPYGIQPRVGIFRAAFGKVNRVHRPEIFQVDYPNVVKNLLGPEGLKMTGLSISWLIPNPWDRWIELTGEVSTPTERDAMYLMHLKTFHELTPNSVLEVGLTGATGVLPEGVLPIPREDEDADVIDRRRVDMEGFNITYRWKPVTYRLRPYKSFLWQTEFIASQPHDRGLENAWGFYTFGEYQLTRRNYFGLRLDYSQFLDERQGDYEWAVQPYWSFWQSDFARLRAAYTHTERQIKDGPGGDDTISVQATFSIGIHRPHPF